MVPSLADGTILVSTGPSSFSTQDQSSFPTGIIAVDPNTGAQSPVSTGGLFIEQPQRGVVGVVGPLDAEGTDVFAHWLDRCQKLSLLDGERADGKIDGGVSAFTPTNKSRAAKIYARALKNFIIQLTLPVPRNRSKVKLQSKLQFPWVRYSIEDPSK